MRTEATSDLEKISLHMLLLAYAAASDLEKNLASHVGDSLEYIEFEMVSEFANKFILIAAGDFKINVKNFKNCDVMSHCYRAVMLGMQLASS